uniref:Uncharacterized protein n=1 Tax=Oryza sativa subsp. japonica TaxID=39947 RepID=Q652X7_ORYSJ|nr:hypothetical protein [Oryza sativa Japonica Group]BAD46140.1 hypothetical protein [Oryza sativa Japonica Group]
MEGGQRGDGGQRRRLVGAQGDGRRRAREAARGQQRAASGDDAEPAGCTAQIHSSPASLARPSPPRPPSLAVAPSPPQTTAHSGGMADLEATAVDEVGGGKAADRAQGGSDGGGGARGGDGDGGGSPQ